MGGAVVNRLARLIVWIATASWSSALLAQEIEPPSEIAGFTYVETRDLGGDAGYDLDYRRKEWWADVYIYDGGTATPVADGSESDKVNAEFANSVMQIQQYYSNVEEGSEFKILRGGSRQFRCQVFTVSKEEIPEKTSYLCLAGAAGKFVKIRLSISSKFDARKRAEAFIAGWADHLW